MLKSIGIFGGAFDPIHKGHIESILYVASMFNFKHIEVIPSYSPNHKNSFKASPSHRLAMVNLAFDKYKDILVNDTEIIRKGISYTIDTLGELRKLRGSNQHFSLIIGYDSLLSFTDWKDWENILNYSSILVLRREAKGELDKKLLNFITEDEMQFITNHGYIYISDNKLIEASSTDIKKQLLKNKKESNKLVIPVQDYIKKNSLY